MSSASSSASTRAVLRADSATQFRARCVARQHPGGGNQVTRARRRVVRLALMLKIACIQPVFEADSYREIEQDLAMQLAGLTPSKRKAVRRQALRSISDAGSLANAADHLVPRRLQQEQKEKQRVKPDGVPILPAPQQMQPPLMHARLANPVLIFGYSTALLLIGSGLGHWVRTPGTALGWCLAGGGSWQPTTSVRGF
jgi:hypothetical protein